MSVVIETTLGDITVDLYLKDRPRACLNFLKLCKIKYYNYNLFHTVSQGFIAQTGDPTGSRTGGESIYGVLDGPLKRYFEAESNPRIKHTVMGLISFVGNEDGMLGSQFFFTLGEELTYLDEKHCVFGEVVEGMDVLEQINEAICDTDDRPYQDIRITHTVILEDPFPDPKKLLVPSRSPSPSAERLQGGRIAPDEEIDETAGKTSEEINELRADREAKARATILEMVGDIPDAEMAPPENVLFVCKLNPVTTDDDLEIIFSRFGKIKSCEVIRDRKTGDSLQYAFVEFEDQKACEDAYFKMDNVLIDDRRIHVDFSQSVSKIKWLGKGRGVRHINNGKEEEKNGRRNGRSPPRNRDYKRGQRLKSPERRHYDSYERQRSSRDRPKSRERYRSRSNERRTRERGIRRRTPEKRHERVRRSPPAFRNRNRSKSPTQKRSRQTTKSSNTSRHRSKERRNKRDSSSENEKKKRKSKKKRSSSSSSSSSSTYNFDKKILTKLKKTKEMLIKEMGKKKRRKRNRSSSSSDSSSD